MPSTASPTGRTARRTCGTTLSTPTHGEPAGHGARVFGHKCGIVGTQAYGPRCLLTTTIDHENSETLKGPLFTFTYANTIMAYCRDLANAYDSNAQVLGSAEINDCALVWQSHRGHGGGRVDGGVALVRWQRGAQLQHPHVAQHHGGQRWNMATTRGRPHRRSLYSMLYNSNTRWRRSTICSMKTGHDRGVVDCVWCGLSGQPCRRYPATPRRSLLSRAEVLPTPRRRGMSATSRSPRREPATATTARWVGRSLRGKIASSPRW